MKLSIRKDDQVVLNSGGPTMTVIEILDPDQCPDEGVYAYCRWGSNVIHTKIFPLSCLTLKVRPRYLRLVKNEDQSTN